MTGFDETVPPDTEIDSDGTAVAENADEHDVGSPEHDSAAPAFEYEADPDEVP
jgi:hypothetical protein